MKCRKCLENKSKSEFSKCQLKKDKKCLKCCQHNRDIHCSPGPNYERNQEIDLMRDTIEMPEFFIADIKNNLSFA